MTTSEIKEKLQSFGFINVDAELKGELKIWEGMDPVPNLVFWAQVK